MTTGFNIGTMRPLPFPSAPTAVVLDLRPGIPAKTEQALKYGWPIEIVASQVDAHVLEQVRIIVYGLARKFNRLDLESTIYGCIFELATNAVRANVKAAYFAEMGWDPSDEVTYQERCASFRKDVLSKDWLSVYGPRAAARGLGIRIVFDHASDKLHVHILNDAPLMQEDARRIQEKARILSRFDNLFEFHKHHGGEENEGSGLGVALAILLLKATEIPRAGLHIGTDGSSTCARIEIPLSAETSP